jgi:hypothetical protein
MRDVVRSSRAEVTRPANAFGETFGLEVPTRYSPQMHDSMSTIMAIDSLLTPTVLGMSGRVVWLFRLMSALHVVFRLHDPNLPLRQRLELEAVTGLLMAGIAIRGTVSHNLLDRLYILLSGVMMIGNSLMTEVNEQQG